MVYSALSRYEPSDMESRRTRLDRFIASHQKINRKAVRLLIARKRILVDGLPAAGIDQLIDQFTCVQLDNLILQQNTPVYLMMNKPRGVVSATRDEQHQTVIDLLDDKDSQELHIAGRLDLNSSGLLLLTNDGRWSRSLTEPENKVDKVYEVTLEKPICDDCIEAFARGMHFGYEDIITQPAKLERLSATVARVTLREGRYHQIKRMFGRFRNPVLALHRISIGSLQLDNSLTPGQSRPLTEEELQQLALR